MCVRVSQSSYKHKISCKCVCYSQMKAFSKIIANHLFATATVVPSQELQWDSILLRFGIECCFLEAPSTLASDLEETT